MLLHLASAIGIGIAIAIAIGIGIGIAIAIAIGIGIGIGFGFVAERGGVVRGARELTSPWKRAGEGRKWKGKATRHTCVATLVCTHHTSTRKTPPRVTSQQGRRDPLTGHRVHLKVISEALT